MPGFRSRRSGPRFPAAPPPDDPVALSRAAVRAALDHGFVAAGVVAGSRAEGWDGYRAFLDRGHQGGMEWLVRDAEARRTIESILPFAKAVLCVAREVPPGGPGNVARYARGEDYHEAVRRDLKAVVAAIRRHSPPGAHFRVCVDTAPVLEREWAVRAGLGFVGKNGMLIVPGVGSHVVLGEVLTDVALAPTAASVDPTWERCGGCAACLQACPTRAILAPRVVDARLCLSYLTIEKRGPFTPEESSWLGGRLFGCDDCQDVCPYNAGPRWSEPAPEPSASLDPAALAALDDEGFARTFAGSAIRRATAEGLRRNARAAVEAAR
ncbi:MAG TPA: tRNA epoxyqueuosine(34) reductase QueG [Thermoanaerobaculia bacterium]|nr:tRNA epoxyqueuosine(34) reductase QueG [Thermoanaerobaculia bacterium]HQP88840.1 tRNA epoxyqueuosine(34) reductase QueG [Thermoanaerobaculia bacterium]